MWGARFRVVYPLDQLRVGRADELQRLYAGAYLSKGVWVLGSVVPAGVLLWSEP